MERRNSRRLKVHRLNLKCVNMITMIPNQTVLNEKKNYLNIKTKTHEVQHQTRDKTMFRMSSTEATITIGELEGIRRVLAHRTHGK